MDGHLSQSAPDGNSGKIDGLRRLLRPRSLAVIGGYEAATVVQQSLKIGFDGEIWPVNPRRADMSGIPCFASLDDLPGAPDAAFVAIPPDATIDAVRRLSAMGAGGAVCYASGFKEVGGVGIQRQEKLLTAAGAMPFVGPNCYGALNYLDGAALWPDQHGGDRVERGAAIVAQSGNISISLTMQQRTVPLAYVISVGNKADLGFDAYVDALALDERVTCIGLIAESIDDIAAFARAAKRAKQAGKPIVVLKAGRSDKGAQATMSHTSSLAGSDALYQALFDALGIARVDDLSTFLEALKLLSVIPPLSGNRVVSMSCSGGEASLMADLGDDLGLTYPDFSTPVHGRLFEVLGDKVAIANPLDYHTYIWENRQAMTDCFGTALSADVDMGVLVLDFPAPGKCDLSGWEPAIEAYIDAARSSGRSAAVLSSIPENMTAEAARRFLEAGVVPLQGMREGLGAIAAAVQAGKQSDWLPAALGPEPVGDPTVLDEWRSKQLARRYGLATPEGSLVTSVTEAVAAAEALGFPVVAKAVSRDLAHKTEAGAVKLNLRDGDAVAAAAEHLFTLSDRVMVEKMVGGAVAELLIGVNRDPQFGLHLVVGAGGELVELLQDAAIILLPATRERIEEALSSLRCAPLLHGYRGRAMGDWDAVVAAVESIAAMVSDMGERILEVDINPLMVLPEGRGAVAADALIRWVEETKK
ncbi:acetate--CoA ligase family protein [Hwanghaeella sp.]|uniref:acetate--CoA ligase family protein n=1 Tax=Hwanghaeella sp. TaxID=2605943 RepID=UPI003CCC076C